MRISCAFAPVPDTPDHIRLAEDLGYHTAWVYDTPALQLDCWMTLARAAERTERIVLGPGVLIPSLRHPVTTAAAVLSLVDLVGVSRVVVGIGTGFTGRRAMGQRPLKWADMSQHVETLRALLRGERVEVDGALTELLHWAGQAPDRPIDVPIVIGVNGPRGMTAATELGCGVFTSRPRPGASFEGVPSATLLAFGTVLDEGESLGDERVLRTAGPGATVAYHAFYEQRDQRLDSLPNAAAFRAAIDTVPEAERHLSVHRGHLTELNEVDKTIITGEAVGLTTMTGSAAEIRQRLDGLAAVGLTDVAFQPMGDIERELRAFAAAAI